MKNLLIWSKSLVLMLVLFACSSDDAPLSQDKFLKSFSILKSENPGKIVADSEGFISGRNVVLNLDESDNLKGLVPTFSYVGEALKVDGTVVESGKTELDFSEPLVLTIVAQDGSTCNYEVSVMLKEGIPNVVPHIKITTEDASITEIPSKDDYLNATLEIDGGGVYENYTGTTEIKGRGNSTWSMPKKPYRLKLNKKASLCGFGEAKNYVLLANHIDPTLMLNAVAFKIARLLDMPFTNHAVPVDVTLNGQYKGSYMLTEQVEVKENRIDLDEDNCIVWELDTNYDEDYKFYSDQFNLPVMVKDPDLTDEQFAYWKNDFNTFLNTFAREPLADNSYVDMIDIESVAKYLLVYNLTHNMEINHPKSVYLHKEGNGKYVMGPVWDFDWAFDYEGTGVHFHNYNRYLWNENMTNGAGCRFFRRFLDDPRVAKLYQDIWADFYTNKMGLLLDYVDDYAEVLKPSAEKNSALWSNTKNFDSSVSSLKQWLKNRADYLNSNH